MSDAAIGGCGRHGRCLPSWRRDAQEGRMCCSGVKGRLQSCAALDGDTWAAGLHARTGRCFAVLCLVYGGKLLCVLRCCVSALQQQMSTSAKSRMRRSAAARLLRDLPALADAACAVGGAAEHAAACSSSPARTFVAAVSGRRAGPAPLEPASLPSHRYVRGMATLGPSGPSTSFEDLKKLRVRPAIELVSVPPEPRPRRPWHKRAKNSCAQSLHSRSLSPSCPGAS
jgi:hypothetical protein